MSPTRRDLFRLTAGAAAALTTKRATAQPGIQARNPSLFDRTCAATGYMMLSLRDERDRIIGECNLQMELFMDGYEGEPGYVGLLSPAFDGIEEDVTHVTWPEFIERAIRIQRQGEARPESIARRERRKAELLG